MKFTPAQKKLLKKYSTFTNVNNEWFIDSGFVAVVPERWDLQHLPYELAQAKKPLPLKDYFNLFIISFEFFLSLKRPANSTKENYYTSVFSQYFEALQAYKKYADEIEEKAGTSKKGKYVYKMIKYDFNDLFTSMLKIYRKKCSKKNNE